MKKLIAILIVLMAMVLVVSVPVQADGVLDLVTTVTSTVAGADKVSVTKSGRGTRYVLSDENKRVEFKSGPNGYFRMTQKKVRPERTRANNRAQAPNVVNNYYVVVPKTQQTLPNQGGGMHNLSQPLGQNAFSGNAGMTTTTPVAPQCDTGVTLDNLIGY